MPEEQRLRLVAQLKKATSLKIDDATDYAEDGACKIRAYQGKWAISIEWHYYEEPDRVWLETFGVDLEGRGDFCPVDQLGDVLNYIANS